VRVKKDVKNINLAQDTSTVVAPEKELRQKQRSEGIHKIGIQFARNYQRRLIQRMLECGSPHCLQRNEEYLYLVLRPDVCWGNLKDYKTAKQNKCLGGFILSRLAMTGIPQNRKDRVHTGYRVNGVQYCWYCMLAFFGMPDGTARKYLYALSSFPLSDTTLHK
jgi:hypothetical protein